MFLSRFIRLLSLMASSWLMLLGPATASPKDSGYALIIGISQYTPDSGNSPLLGVPKDLATARKMAEAMGIPDSNILELRDANATKPNILAALERMKKEVGVGERAFIYFSGHGASFSTAKGCEEGLVPYTKGAFNVDDVISEAELAGYTSKVGEKSDKAIVMIDACFSGGLGASLTRSIGGRLDLQAKFSPRSGASCGAGINQRTTRSFVPAIRRLGTPDQNFVQISAADYNEVSWDSEQLGGLATHSMGQCLFGEAKDLNRSGAISLDEIRSCAQDKINAWMAPHANKGMFPSTIQVRGTRNLIVMAEPPKPVSQESQNVVAPIALPPVPAPPVSLAAEASPPVAAPPVGAPPVASPPVAAPPVALAPLKAPPEPDAPIRVEVPPVSTPVQLALTAPPPASLSALSSSTTTSNSPAQGEMETAADQILASAATLDDIYAQRSGRLKLEVNAPKLLKINRDQLKFSVKSNSDGYLYIVMLGSDGKSFYLLYPNKIDQKNKIKADVLYNYPRNGWSVRAGGPEGKDRLLFVVSQSPRDPKVFVPDEASGGGSFTYSLAELTHRKRLIDFFVGSGVKGKNAQMAAAMITIEEVP